MKIGNIKNIFNKKHKVQPQEEEDIKSYSNPFENDKSLISRTKSEKEYTSGMVGSSNIDVKSSFNNYHEIDNNQEGFYVNTTGQMYNEINNRSLENNNGIPSRFLANKNKLNEAVKNSNAPELLDKTKGGVKAVEDFIIGDVQGIRKDKASKTNQELREDYRISINREDYGEQYYTEEELEKINESSHRKIGPITIAKKKRNKDNKGLLSKILNKGKLNRNEKNKTDGREQLIAKNYQFLRKEIEGYSPLYKLDFLDKIRVTRRYLDEKSGKTARKEAEKFQKEQRKKIEMQSKLKRKLSENLQSLLNKEVLMQRIEITLPRNEKDVLDYVLKQDYFAMFDIKHIKSNPNLKIYKVNMPVVLEFKLAGRQLDEIQ